MQVQGIKCNATKRNKNTTQHSNRPSAIEPSWLLQPLHDRSCPQPHFLGFPPSLPIEHQVIAYSSALSWSRGPEERKTNEQRERQEKGREGWTYLSWEHRTPILVPAFNLTSPALPNIIPPAQWLIVIAPPNNNNPNNGTSVASLKKTLDVSVLVK